MGFVGLAVGLVAVLMLMLVLMKWRYQTTTAESQQTVPLESLESALNEATVDDAIGKVGGLDEVVLVLVAVVAVAVMAAPPGTKGGRKLAISRRGDMTGGKPPINPSRCIDDRSYLHPMLEFEVSCCLTLLVNTGFEACVAVWKSRELNK